MRFLVGWKSASFLEVGLDQHRLLRTEQVLQRLQRGETAFRVLLAVAAGEPHSAHDLAVHHHREAADERGEAALEAPLDAEGLVAGQRRAVRRRSEKMGRAL